MTDRLIRSTDAREVLAFASEMFSPAPNSGTATAARLKRELGAKLSRIIEEQKARAA